MMLVKYRNAMSAATMLAGIGLGFLLFGQAGCGTVCPAGKKWDSAAAMCKDAPPPPVTTCPVPPNTPVSRTVDIDVCGQGQPVSVSYAPTGNVLERVNPGAGGTYTFEMQSCWSYDFQVVYQAPGGLQTISLTMTPEQITNDYYSLEPPGGCPSADPLETPSLQARYADCINFTEESAGFNGAVLICCAADEFANETDVGYLVGGTLVNCVEINETN